MFQFEGANPERAQLFFWIYFCLTGLHSLHVLIGVVLILTLMVLVWTDRIDGRAAYGGGYYRALLALRRYRVGFSLSTALPARGALMPEKIMPVKTYVQTWGALLVLLWLTVGAAYLPLGPFNRFVALAIAGLKAILIVLDFHAHSLGEQNAASCRGRRPAMAGHPDLAGDPRLHDAAVDSLSRALNGAKVTPGMPDQGNEIHLQVVTPGGIALDLAAHSVVLWTSMGEIEILRGHMALVVMLEPGRAARLRRPGTGASVCRRERGLREINGKSVTVLTDLAEEPRGNQAAK